jgi:hypothetical protein
MIKKLLGFHKHPTNTLVFVIVLGIITLGTFTSFFFAWAEDEGTLGSGTFNQLIADSFGIFRFPLHNLLYLAVDSVPFLGVLYFPLLLANIFLQTIIMERVITIVFIRKPKRLRHKGSQKKVA